MAAVLTGLGAFLHARLGAELLKGIDLELRSRAGVISTAVNNTGPVPIDAGRNVLDPDEAFAQILTSSGAIVDASESVRATPLLSAAALRGVRRPTFFTERVPALNDDARLLAIPDTLGGRPVIIIVGANLGDRRDALLRLQLLLVIGIPTALLLASMIGWVVAGAALRPVERIRSEAAAISRSSPDQRLTVPGTRDELARLADTLNQLLGRQQEALDREQRFVDEASHELRTPLAILKAELDLAMSRPRSHAELAATVSTAAVETDRLVTLAERLLVLARSRPGRLPMRPEIISLREFLEASIAPFRAQAITVDAPDEAVRIDPLRMRQVVHNLLDNSLRHGAGGPVAVTAQCVQDGVCISVTDSGPGFPPAVIDGLGLAIVRTVAEAHGGTIELTNLPTGGARVDVFIPAHVNRAPGT